MIRRRRVDRTPGGTVTRRTVTAGSKGLADRQARKVSVAVMTTGTCIMGIICCTYQRGVCMTACTISRSYRYDRSMVGCCCMNCIPGGTVTRCTVASGSKGLANCKAYQVAVAIVTI